MKMLAYTPRFRGPLPLLCEKFWEKTRLRAWSRSFGSWATSRRKGSPGATDKYEGRHNGVSIGAGRDTRPTGQPLGSRGALAVLCISYHLGTRQWLPEKASLSKETNVH